MKEGNEGKGKCEASGEAARIGEKEGKRVRASSQLGCGPPLLSLFSPTAARSPLSFSLRSLQRAGSQPVSQSLTHYIRVSPLCVRRNASLVRVEARTEGKAVCCAVLCVRISRLSFHALSSFHCGQSIAMNSCECSTTNTHSPSFRSLRTTLIALRC